MRDWITFANGRRAQALTEQQRYFRKPLRFDAYRHIVHPDFELLDTAAPQGTPMEVIGRDDEAYKTRQAEKEAYYNTAYGLRNWWAWDATREAGWPPFPPAVSDAGNPDP